MSERPTLLFVGVTTGRSAALRMFPRWAQALGLPEAQIRGVDLPLDADPERYREVVETIRSQEHVRGALITSHKLSLLRAAGDLFDELTEDARLANEVSCIYKRSGRLIGHAIDAESSRRALRLILGDDYWAQHPGAEMLCLGAGGSTSALLVGMLTRNPPKDLPQQATVVDRNPQRLEVLQAHLGQLPLPGLPLRFVCTQAAEQNDVLLAALPAGSLVVNATGMGKDLPGSPITDAALFPQEGVAWDLNYRGDLDFLRQARAQAVLRRLTVADGWEMFIAGWALVVGAVFAIDPFGPVYADLRAAAEAVR